MVIDTPGMREIQIWGSEESAIPSFEDLDSLIISCRFSDCQHNSEPGCAVTAAINSGQIQPDRLETYRKYQRELAQAAEKQSAGMRAQKKLERKNFTKSLKNRPNKKN